MSLQHQQGHRWEDRLTLMISFDRSSGVANTSASVRSAAFPRPILHSCNRRRTSSPTETISPECTAEAFVETNCWRIMHVYYGGNSNSSKAYLTHLSRIHYQYFRSGVFCRPWYSLKCISEFDNSFHTVYNTSSGLPRGFTLHQSRWKPSLASPLPSTIDMVRTHKTSRQQRNKRKCHFFDPSCKSPIRELL